MHLGFSLVWVRPGMVGGAETYALGLLAAYGDGHGPERTTILTNAAGMTAYAGVADRRVDLTFVPGLDPHGSTVKRGSEFARAVLRPRRLLASIPESLDLIHYPVVVPVPRTTLPTVITLHDVRHLEMPRQFSRAERVYRRIAYDEAARRSDLVLTVSEHARNAIIETLDIDADRVIAIHHGLDHSRFTSAPGRDDEAVLAALNVTTPYLFYPANLWAHKNHHTLLAAMSRLRGSGLTLVLTGETYGRLRGLMAEAHRLGVSDDVRHVGYVPAGAIPVLYRHAAAMVYPSLYEGFGAPLLEAMACGCPCVASAQAALEEVAGGAAEVVEPLDAGSIAAGIQRMLDDRERRADLVLRGLARSAEFTWAVAAERHFAAYRRLETRCGTARHAAS